MPPQGINLKPHPEDDRGPGARHRRERAVLPEQEADQERDRWPQLKRIYETRTEDKILYVKADKDLEYGKVLDALDIAAHNGVRVIGHDHRSAAGHDVAPSRVTIHGQHGRQPEGRT